MFSEKHHFTRPHHCEKQYVDQPETEMISFDGRKFGEGESHMFLVSCCSLPHWQHSAVGLQRPPAPPPPLLFIKLNSQLSK